VAAFQQSLALEDVDPNEDVSYLTADLGGGGGRGRVIRRSADLEREA